MASWLESRAKRAEKKARMQEAAAGPPDPEQARRAAERQARTASERVAKVEAGLKELDLWLGDLARRVCITEKTMTGVIDRLERDGYLHRLRDQSDRRVVRVVLTKKGEAEFHRLDAHVLEQFQRFLGLLDKGDREALFRILEKLRDRLAQGGPPNPGEKEAEP